MASTDILTFGPFHLDLRAEQLRRGAEVIPLPPKTFAVLRYLVLHAGTLVTREALQDAIWGTQYVSDAALASCIRDIRQALGEQAQTPQFLETVRGRGFRFLEAAGTAPALPLSLAISHRAASVVRTPMFMVGREAELAALQGCLDRALRGERQVVFITGEPGIGKTALVDAFLSALPLASQALWITRGQCVEHYGIGEAYLPVLEALGHLGQEADTAAIVAVLAQYAPTWLAQLPALVSVPEREGLQRTLQGATSARMLREFADVLEVLTARCPVVLVLEDLHWSDPSTVELLAYVAQRRGLARLLVLATYRPVDVLASAHPLHGAAQELQARGHCQEVRLSFLPPVEVEAYVRGRLARETTPPAGHHLATAIHQWTGGNPLFMVTMFEHLLREGVVTAETGQGHVSPQSTVWHGDIPESVRQLLERQFARLRPEEQQLLEVASVAGQEFAIAAVATGIGQPVDMVETWSAALAMKQHFIRAVGVETWPDGTLTGRYSFVHALYHQTIYDRLAAAHRLRLHRCIGTHKEQAYGTEVHNIAAELARHFAAGHDLQKAVHYCQLAGETALRRHARREAVHHLHTGLALLQELPDTSARAEQELAMHLALGDSLIAMQGYAAPDTEHAYRRAWELCQQMGNTPQLFPALAGLRSFYAMRGEQRTAYAIEEQLFMLARQGEHATWLQWAHLSRGVTLLWLGAFAAARTHLEQGAALPEAHQPVSHLPHYGDPTVMGWSHTAMVLWASGYPDQALFKITQARARAHELADPFSLAYAEATTALIHQQRREGSLAQAWAEDTITRCTEEGIPFWLAGGMMLRGWALGVQGHTQDGIAQCEQGLQAWRATGAANAEPYWLTLLAEGYARADDTIHAQMLVTEALARMEHTEERWWAAELYRVQGTLLLQEPATLPNAEAEAEAWFLRAIATAREQQARSLELRAALHLGRLWQQQGKDQAVRQMLEALYDWFTEGFDTPDLQEATALLRTLGSPMVDTPRPAPPLSTVEERLATVSPVASMPSLEVFQTGRPTLSSPHREEPAPSTALLRHEGDYWTLIFQGTTCRVKDTYGLHYLAQLLRAPQHEIHALDLVRVSRHPGGTGVPEVLTPPTRQARPATEGTHLGVFTDAGDVLDAPARAAYKQRLAALQAELVEAQAWNDPGRSAALQAEIAFLTQELLQAVGLGGRARKAASPAERARVNVTRALRSAMSRITTLHPACGQYLAQTIRTGTFCVYTPDPQTPVTWQV